MELWSQPDLVNDYPLAPDSASVEHCRKDSMRQVEQPDIDRFVDSRSKPWYAVPSSIWRWWCRASSALADNSLVFGTVRFQDRKHRQHVLRPTSVLWHCYPIKSWDMGSRLVLDLRFCPLRLLQTRSIANRLSNLIWQVPITELLYVKGRLPFDRLEYATSVSQVYRVIYYRTRNVGRWGLLP